MVVVNALVYHSKEDECYVAGGYETPQIGTGETGEEAKKDLIKAIKEARDSTREKRDIAFLNAGNSSYRCEEGLQKIILSRMNFVPDIGKIGNLEIHFYRKI